MVFPSRAPRGAVRSQAFALSGLIEVRTAREPDPTAKSGLKGTATLRRYKLSEEERRLSFSLIFVDRTLDVRAATHDEYVDLLQGFRELNRAHRESMYR